MSRLFSDESSEYLIKSSVVGGTLPMTIAGWMYRDEATSTATLVSLDGSSSHYYQVGLDSNGKVRARSRDTVTATAFSTTTDTTLNKWSHVAGVFASNSSRTAYLNGGGKSTETTSVSVTGLVATHIGLTPGLSTSYASGKIAEVGIWSVALSDAEILSLAQGADPRTIQSANLVELWSFASSSLTGINGNVLTAVGTSFDEAQPIIYGDAAQTSDEATQSATGDHASEVTGTSAQTADEATQSATGAIEIAGTIAQAADEATQSAVGAETITGNISQTPDECTQSATSSVADTITGEIAQTADEPEQTGLGAITLAASVAQISDGASQSATASIAIVGALTTISDEATQSLAGSLEIVGAIAQIADEATQFATTIATVPLVRLKLTRNYNAAIARNYKLKQSRSYCHAVN